MDGKEVETMSAKSCGRQTEQESERTTVWGVLMNTGKTEAQRGEWLTLLIDLFVGIQSSM